MTTTVENKGDSLERYLALVHYYPKHENCVQVTFQMHVFSPFVMIEGVQASLRIPRLNPWGPEVNGQKTSSGPNGSRTCDHWDCIPMPHLLGYPVRFACKWPLSIRYLVITNGASKRLCDGKGQTKRSWKSLS